MTHPAALCPNCGAPVSFKWSSSIQTTCEHCHSILIRRDVNLERVGVVSDLPPDSSPIQIDTSGIFQGLGFTVAGRIIYDYAEGSWNEWHIVMGDGRDGWLSDAQNEYAVSFAQTVEGLPMVHEVKVGERFTLGGIRFTATTITRARYRGVQGELPFEYWDKEEATFVDLESTAEDFATLDYSDDQPALYVGKMVEFEDLQLKNLRAFEGWR